MTEKNQLELTKLQSQQLIKQETSILGLAQTEREHSLVLAYEGKKMAKDFDNDDMGMLVSVLGKWRLYLMASKEVDEKDFRIIALFVQKNYPFLRIDEINLAIDLSIIGDLDVDINVYNGFTTMYVSKIINSYYEYKKHHLSNINERREKKQRILLSQSIKPTQQEDRDLTVSIIIDEYNHFNQKGFVKDYFGIVYKFLKDSKRLNFSQEIIDAALSYGNKKAIYEIANSDKSLTDVIGMSNPNSNYIEKRGLKKEALIKQYARNFCVEKLFFSINITELVSSIQLNEF